MNQQKKDKIQPEFLLYILKELVIKFKNQSQGTTIQGVTKSTLAKLQIPLPPLEIQHEIVSAIESEQKLVDCNRELIRIYEEKIKKSD